MKAFYDEKPKPFHKVGNGSYLYRYDIKSYEIDGMEDIETATGWKCQEVVIWGNLTKDKITRAVITDRWDNDLENKILNDYMASKQGVFGTDRNNECEIRYMEFLTEREALKSSINRDWEVFNE